MKKLKLDASLLKLNKTRLLDLSAEELHKIQGGGYTDLSSFGFCLTQDCGSGGSTTPAPGITLLNCSTHAGQHSCFGCY